MSVSSYNVGLNQMVQFTHANSGYAATTTPATGNQINIGPFNSGNCYLKQTTIAGAGTFAVDFCSGGNTDLVGDLINFTRITSLQIQPTSGAIQVETSQSGGMVLPQLGLSGGGFLVNPGAMWAGGDTISGLQLPVTATKGNLVFRAVSGACLLSVGAYGG